MVIYTKRKLWGAHHRLLLLLCLFLSLPLFAVENIAKSPTAVAYLSDVEGNWEKFNNFFARNENFFLGSDGKFHLKPGTEFVFGGDAPDRGPGSLRIVEELLRLKRESGDKVTLLVGNRDVNKVRLNSELKAVRGTGRKISLLKRVLKETMGAPNAFEFRRQELAEISGRATSKITDREVLDSYLKEVGTNGNFTQFLEQGKLVKRIGNTLFTHSGVTAENRGFVPGKSTRSQTVDSWIRDLNHWYGNQMNEWKTLGTAHALVDYGRKSPGQSDNPQSVIYGKNTDNYRNPLLPSKEVIDWLEGGGIKREVMGHNPTGQSPILMVSDSGFEVISGDNSYAPNEAFAHQIILKGKNLAILSVEFTPQGIEGITAPIKFNRLLGSKDPVGRRLTDGSSILPMDGENFFTTRMLGDFRVEYKIRSAEEVNRLGYAAPIFQEGYLIRCIKDLGAVGATN